MNTPKLLTNEEYDYIFDRAVRLSVDLLITAPEGILLSLRDIEPFKGMWHLPGGIVYKNESIADACRRIARAETNLEIHDTTCIGFIEYIHAFQNDHDRHTVSIVIKADPATQALRADYQAKRIEFHSTAPEHIIPEQKKFLAERGLI